ncbi:hypothetical protein QBC46DRAFT_338684 [Diplogelasinospora grovesii]|uniref:Uncharacterized protein n=1 Tax=Diplogelasinospora grovesii TaxID=303347 RepID=A0AAN6S884_9PEZI|nr:hypothetical protein QBC46DRAFT_338684 [Diplogelasinospora grovesii]
MFRLRHYPINAKSRPRVTYAKVNTNLGTFTICSAEKDVCETGDFRFCIFHEDEGCDIGKYLKERYLDEESRMALKSVFKEAAKVCGEQKATSTATYWPEHLFSTQGLLWQSMAKLVDGECSVSSVSGNATGLVESIFLGILEVYVNFHTGSALTVKYEDLQSRKTTIELAPAPPAYEAEAD